ncbi:MULTISPECIES: hypothetical protein [Peribacillus]|uniref:hypothetical protein n=1 Tax=Peribacillus TaxID=2675229 RepID=UPI000CFF1AD3|nr:MULTISPECIES: hypothetical protein [Peribacillus]MCF7624508.1 hypothetical protein [Peribacillus frigoritolerans]MDF1999065.1 hypothetical protein [Peribacillus frigoritolerans]PRA78214.1 hypothetical protein CQ056_24995 [Peribacillus simplex]
MKIKRFIMIILLVSSFTISTNVSASNNNKENEIPNFPEANSFNNRYFSYFITDLYHKEIMEAFQSYYKSKGLKPTGYGPSSEDPDYGMVSIYFGNDFSDKFSYMLKVSLSPTTDKKVLGRDTLYFAVEPSRQLMKDLPKEYAPIKLVKYEHKEP